MSHQSILEDAKKNKKDEFYTQLTDIEKELRYYKKHFEDKTVFCNCDDPFESNFFRYFVLNFNRLKLKKLIATCYSGSPIMGQQLSLFDIVGGDEENKKKPYKAVVTKVYDATGDGAIMMDDIAELFKTGENKLTELEGNGDFRSDECIDILKESDIVVTNPPFSLFREYVSTLVEYEKKFIIIGNVNAINYKDFFPLLKDNKVWIGPSIHSGDRAFYVPDDYPLNAAGCGVDEDGRKYIRVKGIRWYTNLDIKQRHEELILTKRYSKEEFPKFDNYNAINVNATSDIPCDYKELMGVPVTFIDKYNPDQFEILGFTSGREEYDKRAWPTKQYKNAVQHNKDGSTASGSKVNTGAEILLDKPPKDKVYYTADNVDGYLIRTYGRIIIRNKKPEKPKEKRK